MKDKKAFTLAEMLIVLVILGVIASITIPALVNRHVETERRTKLRKAMTVYDTALNKMVIENGIRSNDALINEFNADHNNNSCAKSRAYFKSTQDGVNDCTFRASDGVWWNIEDITRPKLDLKNGNFDDENSQFQLFGHIDNNGSLRVDDIQYDTANVEADLYIQQTDVENLTKLWNFVNNVKTSAEKVAKSPFEDCDKNPDKPCVVNGLTYNKVTLSEASVSKITLFILPADVCMLDREKNEQICPYTSSTEGGSYWISQTITSVDDYKSYLDSNSSFCADNEYCKENDYYNAAKRFCEDKGGRLPKAAELKSGGYLGKQYIDPKTHSLHYDKYFASEEMDSDTVLSIGKDGNFAELDKATPSAFFCVGN